MTRSLCVIEHCEKPVHGRGWCMTHYKRAREGTLETIPWRDLPDGMRARDCVCGAEIIYEATRWARGEMYCLDCKRVKANENSKRYRDMNLERVREKDRQTSKARRQQPGAKERLRRNYLKHTYGLTPAEYETLLAAQSGLCGICRGDPTGPGKFLHVDHCHESGAVRGLLCSKCNTMLGLAKDNMQTLLAAIEYLRGQ